MNMSWRLDGASLLLYHRKHYLLLHQGIWRSGVRRSVKFYFDLMIECMHVLISFLIFTPQGRVQKALPWWDSMWSEKKKKKNACIYLFSNNWCFGLLLPINVASFIILRLSIKWRQTDTLIYGSNFVNYL